MLVRGRKYRGGTPSGERAAFGASRARMARNIGRHAPGGVLLPFYLLFVAWMKRSDIQERHSRLLIVPGLRFTPSGLLNCAEHDRAKNRSHRRFRRDAMMLGESMDALYGIPRARIASREWDCFSSSPTQVGEGDHTKCGGGGV